MTSSVDIWPPRVYLSPSQRRQVLDHLREHPQRCPACGGSTVVVGEPGVAEAWHDEADVYRIVIRCGTARCRGGSWSVRLRARQFLHPAG